LFKYLAVTVVTTARTARARATHHPEVGHRPGTGPEPVASAGEMAARRSAQHRLVRPVAVPSQPWSRTGSRPSFTGRYREASPAP